MPRSFVSPRAAALLLAVSMPLLGVSVGPAFAQPAPAAVRAEGSYAAGWLPPEGAECKPSKTQIAEAKMLYQVGKGEHLKENYAVAIEYYKDAYRRDCTAHLLLSNISKALEVQGQYQAALEMLRIYGARSRLSGEELLSYHERLIDLTKKVSTLSAGGSASVSDELSATASSAAPSVTPPPSATGPEVPPPPPSNARNYRRATLPAWITVGVGGATMIAGAIMIGTGQGRVTEVVNARNELFAQPGCAVGELAVCYEVSSQLRERLAPAQSLRNAGIVTLSVGGAIAVGGLVWYLLTPRSEHTHNHKVHVTAGPTGLGFGLAGSF